MSGPRLALWAFLLAALSGTIGYRLSQFLNQPPAPAKVVFVTGGSGPYWQLTVNGAKAAARRNLVDLRVEMPADDESIEQQAAILEKLDPKAVDGVALSPLDGEGQTPLINKLIEDTFVVTFDSDAPGSKRLSYVGTGNFTAGRQCARLVSEALPEGGKVAVLLANLTKENLIDRKGGFQERMAQYADDVEAGATGPKYEVVDYLVDNGDSEKCVANIRETLEKYPDLACFVGMNARHGPILVRTLKELDKLGQVRLVTFDMEDETLQGIADGHIFATIAQDPYQFGFEAVAMLAKMARGDETSIPVVGRGSFSIAAEPIYQQNLNEFRAARGAGQVARRAQQPPKRQMPPARSKS